MYSCGCPFWLFAETVGCFRAVVRFGCLSKLMGVFLCRGPFRSFAESVRKWSALADIII